MERILGFLFGILLGIVLQRGQFCMTSAFRDFFINRDTYITKGVFLSIFLTMIGFFFAYDYGFIAPANFPYIKEAGLHNVIGGIIFGVGMVLAGGCASGTLYRIGEGNTASMVALVGMLFGIGIFAEVYEYALLYIIKPTSLGKVTLYQALEISPWYLILVSFILTIGIMHFTKA
jgi:hypothetical protein